MVFTVEGKPKVKSGYCRDYSPNKKNCWFVHEVHQIQNNYIHIVVPITGTCYYTNDSYHLYTVKKSTPHVMQRKVTQSTTR